MTAAALLITGAAWGGFFALFLRRGFGRRSSFLAASITWGVMVTLFTELPSLFRTLTPSFAVLVWTTTAAGAWSAAIRTRRREILPLPSLCPVEKRMLLIIAGILGTTLVIALLSPPNNWDSLTYHLTRVMFWIQNHSVAHFPTNNLRQIELAPWAEFAIVQLQMLTGGDRAANIVQWFAFSGCIVAASAAAGLLGGNLRVQLLAGFLAATTPMAILQATSTQNDLVVAFWLLCFIVFGLASSREGWRATLLMSCALGLGVLTKATAYIFALPFLAGFFLRDLRRSAVSAAGKYLLLAAVVTALNFGHTFRNYRLFHNPLHSGTMSYTNSHVGIAALASNISRNALIHLLTPIDVVNDLLQETVDQLHEIIGIADNDPGTSWMGMAPEDLKFGFHEDHSGNFLLFLLAAASLIAVAANRRWWSLARYAAAVAAGSMLFCIALRWQPWGSRLHLPLFMMIIPVCARIAASASPRILRLTVATFSLAALPYLLCNYLRPLISLPGCPKSILALPRETLLFQAKPQREAQFRQAAEIVRARGFRTVGIRAEENSWEYPFWVLTREGMREGMRIEHVGVRNVSASLIRRNPSQPEAVVTILNSGEVSVEETLH